ncbi:MAG: hypothetical protein ACKVX7_20440 [Planctomycetota bacterium]
MRHVFRARLATSVLALVAAFALLNLGALRAGGDDEPNEHVFLLGSLKKIALTASDGQLEVTVQGKSYQVASLKEVVVLKHDAVRMADLKAGTILRVLGRRQEASRDLSDRNLDPQIIQIAAVTTANLPLVPLSAAQQKAKLKWISGTLGGEAGKVFQLDGTNMQIGGDRLVLTAETGKPADFTRGARVRLKVPRTDLTKKSPPKGEDAEAGAKTLKPLHPVQIEFLTDKFPAKEYSQVFGE